jgi:putative hydrolase of the HAD superfamily
VRAVIFDFDGLLMDTESTSFLSWQYEWSQWGLTLQVADFFVNHGGDVTEDRYARLAAAAGPRFDRALSHRRRVAYRDKLHEELDLADGLRGWLDEAASLGLHAAGMRCIAIPNPFVALERVRDADLVLSSASQLRLADALGQLS